MIPEFAETAAYKLSFWARVWLYLLTPFFAWITFNDKTRERIAEHVAKGTVVHVFQFAGYLDFLLFNYYLRKQGLPPVAYPRESRIRRFWRRLTLGKPVPRRLDHEARIGEQYMLFLQSPGSFLSVLAQTQIDELADLLEIQRHSATPIYLLPHITIWTARPLSATRSWKDIVLGHALNPSGVRKLLIFLRNFRTAFVHSGQPLSLAEAVAGEAADNRDDKGLIKDIRWRLFTFFSEERMAVMGPLTRPRTWILESVLNSDAVQATIHEVAREQDLPPKAVLERAARLLDFMAADFKHDFIVMASLTLQAAFSRLFTHLEIEPEGMERIRELIKRGAVVYVPSHKSHIDYLAMSYVLFRHRLAVPHIIAGENLAFWPMGFLFRRMGAVFIKRSFRGDKLYATLLRQYLQRMLQEGFSQEFFIEGTRSRTGKLLAPKFGILSIYVDAFLRHPARDVQFVPINIIYSRVVEESAHVRELTGGEKKKESAASLLKIFDALRIQHGAMYVRVGEPISLQAFMNEQHLTPEETDETARHELIQRLGYNIIRRIDAATTVTPSSVVALALLGGGKRGLSGTTLRQVIDIIIRHLRLRGAHFAVAFGDTSRAISETLEGMRKDKTLVLHEIAEERIYTVSEQNRYALDYYKNNLLHSFVGEALFAHAFLACRQARVSEAALLENARYLRELFRHDILFDAESSLEELYARTRRFFLEDGVWREVEGGLEAGERRAELTFYGHLFDTFLESYWVVASAFTRVVGRRVSQKRFIKFVLEEGHKMALTGEIERLEATSKTNFQNALSAFQAQRVLIRTESEEDTTIVILPKDTRLLSLPAKKPKPAKRQHVFYELYEDYNTPEATRRLADNLRHFLVRG